VRALACAPARSDVAAALVGDSVWTTADGGRRWTRAAVLSSAPADAGSAAVSSEEGEVTDARGVIPDFEPEPLDEQHRVGATELGASTAGESDRETAASSAVDLSVGNDGSWAALLGNQLFVGRSGKSVTGRALIEGSLGVHVDGRGGLWVTSGQLLLHYPLGTPVGSAPRRYPFACTGPPVRGTTEGELLVPVRDGVVTISLDQTGEPTLELVRSGPVAAVAPSTEHGLLVVARGRISSLARSGVLSPLQPAPGRVRELLVARDGTLWVLIVGGGWVRGGGAGLRATTALTVAVDARGRIWIGTPHGPRGPGESSGPPVPSRPLPQAPVGRFVAGAMSVIDRELGNPPCRPPLILVPGVRLVFGVGRGSTRTTDLPGPIEEAGIDTWVYAELRLNWSFGPVSPTECVARFESAAELRGERRRRVASLVEAWRRAVALEEEARSAEEIIEARTQRDRLAELIRIASGIHPQKE